MTLSKKTLALLVAGAMFSASSAFAQVGGGNETPDAAKAKGTASGGTEGKSMESGSMSNGGMMKKKMKHKHKKHMHM